MLLRRSVSLDESTPISYLRSKPDGFANRANQLKRNGGLITASKVLVRPSSSCVHDHGRLCIPGASPPRTTGREKSINGLTPRPSLPAVRPSSISSFHPDLSNARRGAIDRPKTAA